MPSPLHDNDDEKSQNLLVANKETNKVKHSLKGLDKQIDEKGKGDDDEESQSLLEALVEKKVTNEVQRITKELEQKIDSKMNDTNETGRQTSREKFNALIQNKGLVYLPGFRNNANEEKGKEEGKGEKNGEGLVYLDEDTFTMMMISPMDWSCSKCCCFLVIPCALFAKRSSWVFGLIPAFIQLLLCVIIISDQTDLDLVTWAIDGFTFKQGPPSLNVPMAEQTIPVCTAQFFTIPLAVMTQTDVLAATRTFLLLRHGSWRKTISRGAEDTIQGGCLTWIARVFIPISLKFAQGTLVLFITWLIIVQSENAIELLKDYAALFVISSIDDMFYYVAVNGYLGQTLESRATEAKSVQIFTNDSNSTDGYDAKEKSVCAQIFLFLFILCSMLGGWVVVLLGRRIDFLPFWIYKNDSSGD